MKILMMLSMLTTLFTGCAGQWDTLYKGTYNGEDYIYQVRETKGFSTNSFDWRIKLGKRKPIAIDATTTDWGPPYSNDIFGASAYLYFDSSKKYSNEPFMPGKEGTAYSMLYIPSKDAEDDYTNTYFELLRHEWKILMPYFKQATTSGGAIIIGVVAGAPEDFEQQFKGIYNGKNMVLLVRNDGRIAFMQDDKLQNEEFVGLWPQLQIPGKVIYIDENEEGLKLADLKNFKNKYGSSPLSVFKFEKRDIKAMDKAIRDMPSDQKKLFTKKWHEEHGEKDSYIWFKEDGTLEMKDTKGIKTAKWDYEYSGKLISIYEGAEATYKFISVSADGLRLGKINTIIDKNNAATVDEVPLSFKPVN